MSLTNKTLAELARLNSGINPTFSAQNPAAPNTALASPVLLAAFGTIAVTAINDDDGVDVSSATYCVISVIPTGGNVVFDIASRSTNKTGSFENLSQLEGLDVSTPWKQVIFCGPEEEIIVIPQSGTATSVEIEVGPCLG